MGFAASYYYPEDVQNVFLNDQGDDEFEVLVQLESGHLYRMDTVSFTSSRYQLFEDISDLINSHRDFRGFDDEDMADLVWGVTPFNANEITDVKTRFEEGELTIILSFATGDEFRTKKTLANRFSSSVEVTQFVTDAINEIEEIEGQITTAEVVVMHEEPYTGLSYFAPYIDAIVIVYNQEEKNFTVTATFGSEEVRQFALDYKDTKEQLIQDTTAIINDVYVEYEDAKFVTGDVSSKVTWQGVPWMIDDIERITVVDNTAASGTMAFTVRARLSNDLVGVIEMNRLYGGEVRDLNQVSISATEALEEHELFVHDFNVALVYDILVESLDEDGREYYGISPGGYEEGEEGYGTDQDDEEEEEIENGEVSQEMIDLLIAIIIQYVLENGLDIDLSGLI